ncbi:MAG: recombination mediator protein UvsY [Flavobacterium sp.]|uniref:recombination mediator protein UvsY n=1 Tax=Flavobacterium sp. TaxID=239 RepID=UPI0026366B42|nr:recombination mediator protein UvsY [Flavobacterium sp.]MDD5151794.1 recombination mediator protein UvsY [Flavobacterium sp.]
MKTKEIQEMMDEDSIIDASNLDIESLKIPMLHNKYYNIYIEEYKIFKALENSLKQLTKFKNEYYLGKCPDEIYQHNPLNLKVLKADVDNYIQSDQEIIDLNTKIIIQKTKVEMLDAFIKQINQRSFNIKNAIEFLRFKNGGY